MVQQVFSVADMDWRGIGAIAQSGLKLRDRYSEFDAEKRFAHALRPDSGGTESQNCRAGQILQGLIKPPQCEHFGKACRPETPLGAPMVSSEGACAAYYHYSSLQDAV